MSYIFYDFETTGLDTIHQILTACFIETDKNFNITSKRNWNVALNPLEIPSEHAINVTGIDIRNHMYEHGAKHHDLVTETQFAHELNDFLGARLFDPLSALIGYNSNKFDIKHLRKVLIKYGYNPYYNYNNFAMVDIFNHTKLLVIGSSIPADIENLQLGTVYQKIFGRKSPNAHNAEADVMMCIEIAQRLKKTNYDIVLNNGKTNNLFSKALKPGELVYTVNPYSESRKEMDKHIVHDIQKNYILLEQLDQEEKKFRAVSRNDFCLCKTEHESIDIDTITLEQHFASGESRGTENFIYDIKFQDFKVLADTPYDTFIIPMESPLDEILNSRSFTSIRPIEHHSHGFEYNMTEDQKQYFLWHYETYMKKELETTYPEMNENLEAVQLVKDYKQTYKDLYHEISNEIRDGEGVSRAEV